MGVLYLSEREKTRVSQGGRGQTSERIRGVQGMERVIRNERECIFAGIGACTYKHEGVCVRA